MHAALVCTEVVYKAYEPGPGMRGLGWAVPEIFGRPVLPPNDMVRQFDLTVGTPDRQLDLALFFDGDERAGTAIERGVEAFRESWRAAEWQLLTQPWPSPRRPLAVTEEHLPDGFWLPEKSCQLRN